MAFFSEHIADDRSAVEVTGADPCAVRAEQHPPQSRRRRLILFAEVRSTIELPRDSPPGLCHFPRAIGLDRYPHRGGRRYSSYDKAFAEAAPSERDWCFVVEL